MKIIWIIINIKLKMIVMGLPLEEILIFEKRKITGHNLKLGVKLIWGLTFLHPNLF